MSKLDPFRRLFALGAMVGFLAVAALQPAPAAEKPNADQAQASPKWVRTVRDDAGRPLAMQTAIVSYAPADGDRADLSVHLIGAVHVGDRGYYDKLNREFEACDALLYELVAPPGAKVPLGGGTSNRHPVGAMQNGIKEMLDLEHQLVCIDYTKRNFVHADMTPDQFAQSMADRGEGFFQIMLRMMGQSLAHQSKQAAEGKSTDLELMAAFFGQDRAVRLKRILAEQFEEMESMLVGFGGPDGSTLIHERNKVALEVLERQIEAGRKKIGIFYGAGHMADMDERLRRDFKLAPVETRWVDAWNLRTGN